MSLKLWKARRGCVKPVRENVETLCRRVAADMMRLERRSSDANSIVRDLKYEDWKCRVLGAVRRMRTVSIV